MADFNTAIQTVLLHEGGFVDNPADRGGATNFGITQAIFDAYCEKHDIVSVPVKQMPLETAQIIYKEFYWDPLHLDDVKDQALATVVLDLAVLRGVPSIVKLIQMFCRLPVDGIFGPATALALQQKSSVTPALFAFNLIWHSFLAMSEFAAHNPTQKIFCGGWLQRMKSLAELVDHEV